MGLLNSFDHLIDRRIAQHFGWRFDSDDTRRPLRHFGIVLQPGLSHLRFAAGSIPTSAMRGRSSCGNTPSRIPGDPRRGGRIRGRGGNAHSGGVQRHGLMRTTWMPSRCCSWMARSIHSSCVSIKMTSHSGCLTSLTRGVYNSLKMLTDFHARFVRPRVSLDRRFRLNRPDSPNSAPAVGRHSSSSIDPSSCAARGDRRVRR